MLTIAGCPARQFRRVRAVAVAIPRAACALLSACRTGRNCSAADVPRFADSIPTSAELSANGTRRAMPDSLRLVTFNIKFARRIDESIRVLTTNPVLRAPDLLFLQVMDASGTAPIAAALGMVYVYYPATRREGTGRDFGNALLSRWPIVSDTRIVLRHPAHTTDAQRTATAAMYPYIIIGGDMNSAGVDPVARQHSFAWPTARGARSTLIGRRDHFSTRGFDVVREPPSGVSRASRAASDHSAVWVTLPVASELPVLRARLTDRR